MNRRVPLVAALVAALGACDFEDSLRKLVSNQGDRKMATPDGGGSASGPREKEPNNVPDVASPITLGNELRDTRGVLSTPDDVDWFAVTAKKPGPYELALMPDGALDVALQVEVKGSAALSYDNGKMGGEERIAALELGPEPQRLVVRSAGGTSGTYVISFRRQLAAGIEGEPNDEATVATKLGMPGEIQGGYDRPDDRDVYRLTAEPGRPFQVELGTMPGTRQMARFFTDDRLTDAAMSVQIVDLPVVVPNVAVPTDKPLYLVLTPLGEPAAEQIYRVKAAEHPSMQVPLELEPNDQVPQPLPFGEPDANGARSAMVVGYLHVADDRDSFLLQPPPQDPSATPIAPDDAPAALARFMEKPRPKVPVSAVVSWTNPNASYGMYFEGRDGLQVEFRQTTPDAEVRACGLDLGDGSAVLGVRAERLADASKPGSPQYKLTVTETSSSASFEAEPNNDRDTADALRTVRRGTFAVPDDVDVFAFAVEGEPATTQMVSVDLVSPKVDLTLRVTDEAGGVVANVNNAAIGSRETIRVELPPGLYFAEARWTGGELCLPYTLSIQR